MWACPASAPPVPSSCSCSRRSPPRLRADWIVTPYAGITFNTRAVFTDAAGQFENTFGMTPTFGASLTRTHAGMVRSRSRRDCGSGLLRESNTGRWFPVRRQSADLRDGQRRGAPVEGGHLGWPQSVCGGRRRAVSYPHRRSHDAFDASGNQLAFDAGGGVTRAIGGRLRLQVDARYFRTLQGRQPKDELDLAIDSLSFWRITAGIGFRF